MSIPLRNQNAPAVRAEEAFRLFCRPAAQRPADYDRLAKRARFHLRHAVHRECAGLKTYILEPPGSAKGTILLIHGWTAEASFMAAIAEPLRRSGFRAILMDLPAHGRSPGGRASLADCARAAHRVAVADGPLHGLVGHSLGGMISLWLAEGGPPLPFPIQVAKIAILATPDRFIELTRDFGAGLKLCLHGQLGFERRLSRTGRRPVERFSSASMLSQIAKSEVLVVHSADDERIPFHAAESIAAVSPRAKLLKCDGLGHSKLLYDTAVIRSVMAFLADR